MASNERLLLIDLMPILYRGYFVFLHRPRRTASGINTSPLSLFASTLEQLLRDLQPTHLAIAAESISPTFRHERFPAYKAQREKMPEDIAAAIGQAEELAKAWGLHIVREEGFEADDVLGTLATRGVKAGFDVIIASPDKDLGQLAEPGIRILHPGEKTLLTEKDICEHWELDSAQQLIDYLALSGDASDNVPGVSGIGPKTAKQLLKTYGSVENILEHTGELSQKMGDKIREHAEEARLSKFLVTIVRDAPINVEWDTLCVRPPKLETLAPVLLKYELNLVANRLGIAATTAQMQLFAGGGLFSAQESEEVKAQAQYQTLEQTPHAYQLVTSQEAREALAQELASEKEIAFDVLASGVHPRLDRMLGCSFALVNGRAWYVPMPEDEVEQKVALEPFRKVLEAEGIVKIGHGLKFDRALLRRLGFDLGGSLHDTLLAHYLVSATDRHDLDHVANEWLHYAPIAFTSLIGANKEHALADLPVEKLLNYAAERADVAFKLDAPLRQRLGEMNLTRLFEDCETPLSGILLGMEEEGVRIEPSALRHFRLELESEIIKLELAIREYTGAGVNLASPKQMGEVLFGRLNIDPTVKRTTRGQFPTNEELLLKLRDKHPIVDLLLDWRACVKLKNTYVDRLPEHIDPVDGRIHTTFNQTFTDTGRLSSSDPNLQNIPVRSERGQRIRAAFVARAPGWKLLSADYSQVELRLTAAISKDAQMIAAFQRGEDIHAQTASVVYGIPLSEVTAHQRTRCKMVNFGIIYGISAFGLASRLRIPRKEAQALINTYFERYPAIKAYMDNAVETARKLGYAQTLFGRQRAIPEIASRNATTRTAAERIAINMPIQGTAADIIKFAMIRISDALRERALRTRMILQIHDELLFDVPEEEVEIVKPLIHTAMEQVISLEVPLAVTIGVGADWLSAH